MAEASTERILDSSRLSLEAATGLGYASFLVAHAELEPEDPSLSALFYWIGAFLLIVWPLLTPLVKRRCEGRSGAAGWVARWFLLSSAVPLVFLDSDVPAHWMLAVLTLAQGHLLVRYRSNRASAWILALGPTQVLAAMAAAPGQSWLVLFPLSVAISAAGLVLLSWRHAQLELEERAPRVFLREWLGQRKTWDTRTEIWQRLRGVLPIAFAVLAATVVLYPLLAGIPRPSMVHESDLGLTSDSAAAGTGRAGRPTAEREALGRIFPSSIHPGAGLASLEHETVMTVRAFPAGEISGGALYLGSLYLRGLCLDTFSEEELSLYPDSKPQRYRDEEDRTRDGWVKLAEGPPRVVLLEIHQQVLRLRDGRWDVLFAPQPLLAVEAPEIHYDPDGLLAFERDEDAVELWYSLVVDRPEHNAQELARQSLVHPDPRFLQLPRSSPDLLWIARRGQELTRGRTDDYQRLRAILDHFDDGYRYSLDTSDVPGPKGIVDFMRRRKGHCTSYAAAAVLLLRTQRIPSRVATGFLAKEYSEEERQYVVSSRNGHAWIEVYFESSGWVAFDPTPASRREEALAAAEAGLDEGIGSWFEEFSGDLRAWAESGADRTYLSILVETLAGGPRALWATIRRSPGRSGAALLLGLALTITIWRLRWRRVRNRSLAPAGRRSKRTRLGVLIEQLWRELARLGHRRNPGQTLQEVAGRASVGMDELPELVGILYAARFGGRLLDEEEYSRIESWIRNQVHFHTPGAPEEVGSGDAASV